jgi:flavin-dependent dehydrogenase
MNDVIVVGAGPAGSLAATILARAGLSVRIFDRARFPRHKLCGDTLNPGALRVLSAHMAIDPIVTRGLPLEGMLLTGPAGVEVRGRYGRGLSGRSMSRRELDMLLVEHATAAGARLEEEATVTGPTLDRERTINGVTISTRAGSRTCRGRIVIGADGRASRLARGLRLARYARAPRRWAIGGYFAGVAGLAKRGEMHVRRGRYIGVAPLPDGLANVCLVMPEEATRRAWHDPARMLPAAIADDEALAPRFARARLVATPQVFGPMAVDSARSGAPGLLLAGDAAGFIDPMTGDGLRLALRGAELAATVAIDVLSGRLPHGESAARLTSLRRAAFARKWRFNRSLRALVASGAMVSAAAMAACILPSAFEAIIRYAGDCHSGLPAPADD